MRLGDILWTDTDREGVRAIRLWLLRHRWTLVIAVPTFVIGVAWIWFLVWLVTR
jgi:hypothetical protein